MKLVNAIDYLLLIDEEAEIKRGDYILEKESIINVFPDYLTDLDECDKIIAYRKLNENVKELDLPLLPNPFEVREDLEELFYENCKNLYDSIEEQNIAKLCFYQGYKAAQSKQLENFIKTFNETWKKFGNP